MVIIQNLEVCMLKNFIVYSFVTAIVLSSLTVVAQLEVPQDELAQETVYPIFDNPVSVKNRNIKDSKTIDIGIFGGLALTEPISNTAKFGLAINYHFSEIHSLGAMFIKNSSGLSADAQGLKNDFGLDFFQRTLKYLSHHKQANLHYQHYYRASKLRAKFQLL